MGVLLVERAAAVTTITIHRPEVRNAMNNAAFEELAGILAEAARNPDDRVLVLTGAAGAFCSGGDLSLPAGMAVDAATAEAFPLTTFKILSTVVASAALALHRFPKPIIAAVDGIAAGAGACLAFGCDLVLASETARFSLAFVRRGLSLDCGGSWLLPRLIGLHKAKELAFFGDWVDAHEAVRLGLANRAFTAAEFPAAVRTWAERLAAQPPIAVSLIKQSLNRSLQLSMADALEQEAMAQAVCSASPEFARALAAFARPRAPKG